MKTTLTPDEVNYLLYLNGELDQWRQKGFFIVVSPANVLQIDQDINDNMIKCDPDFELISLQFGLNLIKQSTTISKSGGDHHYLQFDQQFTIEEKIRLQVEFESDPHSKYLAYERLQLGIKDCIVMIEVDICKVSQWAIDHLI